MAASCHTPTSVACSPAKILARTYSDKAKVVLRYPNCADCSGGTVGDEFLAPRSIPKGFFGVFDLLFVYRFCGALSARDSYCKSGGRVSGDGHCVNDRCICDRLAFRTPIALGDPPTR